MTTNIIIENLKCNGCANTIKKGILSLDNVIEVDVSLESSEVIVTTEQDILTQIKEKLSKMGYPEVGGKNSVLHKAKSFVSCAIGRIED